VAGRLTQEFIRIKQSSESDRAAILGSLLSRTFTERVIVFFDTKVAAHRFSLLLGLLGVKNAELHGDLTQIQRLESLEMFRSAKVQS
jgi:ATP-dependent RNA helicase DDX27